MTEDNIDDVVAEPRLLAFGFNGKLGETGTLAMIRKKDRQIKIDGNGFENLSHYAALPFDFEPVVTAIPHEVEPEQFLREWLTEIYQKHGKYGPFGDVLVVIRRRREFVLVSIAPKAFRKPGVAADLVPFLVDSRGHRFFVGIRRGQNPGKGRPALIGGFLDIAGYHLENAIQCLSHEGVEEVGMKIRLKDRAAVNASISPFPKSADVAVEFAGEEYDGTLRLVEVIYTGREEEWPSLNEKRVHMTAVYTLQITVNRELTAELIEQQFIPRDLVEGNKVAVFEVGQEQKFGLSHHETAYHLALAELEAGLPQGF